MYATLSMLACPKIFIYTQVYQVMKTNGLTGYLIIFSELSDHLLHLFARQAIFCQENSFA
jgi:hypothetical protein